jgi:hypothetical protein
VGWALLFASVTCLQGYIRWDLFVLWAQPLKWIRWVCAGTRKCSFLLNCLSVPYLSLRFPRHFLGTCPGLWRWWFVTSLVARRRFHQAPMDSLISRRGSSSQWVEVKASGTQRNPVRCRDQQGEGSTSCQTGKNLGWNSGLLQEAEGEPDHLPETP